jgi:hypothetical protein
MNYSTPRVSVEPRAVKGKWFLEITKPRRPINDLRKKMRRTIHRYFVFIRTINIKNRFVYVDYGKGTGAGAIWPCLVRADRLLDTIFFNSAWPQTSKFKLLHIYVSSWICFWHLVKGCTVYLIKWISILVLLVFPRYGSVIFHVIFTVTSVTLEIFLRRYLTPTSSF